MNGTEQQRHTRVTDELKARLENIETVLAALDDRVSAVAQATIASVNQERTHRLKLADEQRAYVDRRDGEVQTTCLRQNTLTYAAFLGFCDRPFWQRVRWLIRGHGPQ